MAMDDDFLRRLRATFRTEAEEHLQAITAGVMTLERNTDPAVQRSTIDGMFRAAHSLKGAARAVDLRDVESWCQTLEDTFADWKGQPGPPPVGAFDSIHQAIASISSVLGGSQPPSTPDPLRWAPRSTPPAASAAGRTSDLPPADTPAALRASREDTVRIDVGRLSAQLLKAEEMLLARQAAGHQLDDLTAISKALDVWKKHWTSVEQDVRALAQAPSRSSGEAATGAAGRLPRVLEFLQWNLNHVRSMEGAIGALCRTARQDSQTVGRLVDDLLEGSKRLLLLPFGTITPQFPKLVRDLCRDQQKEADLLVRGEDVELDKRILEEIKAPLVHLLRNAVDHGVERPDVRARAGKPPRATISLVAERADGDKVNVRVADGGAGIDLERVKTAAVERGLLSAAEARELDDERALRLVFAPELSTSPVVTRVSGRGLGLAIVREAAEKLGGTVTVDSVPGQGTSFLLTLPATLATFRGIVVEAGERAFVVPTLNVERVVRVNTADVRTMEGREAISVGGQALAFVRLADLLGLPAVSPAAANRGAADAGARPVVAVILGTAEQRIALAVDDVVDEHEVLVKPLRRPLVHVRNIAGATVLASGRVVPILHVSDLLKTVVRAGDTLRPPPDVAVVEPRQRSILVAEDSITSRILIKGILESAGYAVTTAVDGLDALVKLRSGRFDLLVSDVEMPRLNGFALTEQVRADKQLAELPVVLVTALAKADDRARGVDVGADAYIVKSTFDQSDLLEAVQRLI